MSKETMKLALEALEIRCGTNAEERGPSGAITALREALAEQPAQQCKWPTCQSDEYQQALAEQIKRELVGEQPAQQEPVEVDCCANCLRPEREHQDGKCPKPFTTVWHAWDYDFPPDAPPAQRKPLTIAEVEQILGQHNYEIHGDRARYIVRMTEAAHGIKENT